MTALARFARMARSARALTFPCLLALAATAPRTGVAGPVPDRVKASGTVRVCIWPDYYGITFRDPRNQQLSGIDIELSAQFAQDLQARLEYVDSSFVTLIDDVKSGRCDVAMFAVGMLPQRMEQLRFTRPYLRSDIYGVTTKANHVVRQWADNDKPGVLVGVQAGTFMEPVMGAALKQARMVVVRPPATCERELEAGRIDVFMTDYPYSRHLLDNADWARLIAPPQAFHAVDYAYAVKPGDDSWLQAVNAFVAAVTRDGRLKDAAKQHGLTEILAVD